MTASYLRRTSLTCADALGKMHAWGSNGFGLDVGTSPSTKRYGIIVRSSSGNAQAVVSPLTGRRRANVDKVSAKNQILVTRVGLKLPEVVAFGRWEQAGHKLSRITDSSAWCLGDWLNYGHNAYSDRYRRVVDAAGLDYQTLRNYAWTARQFEIERRRENLSFQHHAEVAALSQEEQNRWLDDAEKNGWSRNQLRSKLRESRRPHEKNQQPSKTALLPSFEIAPENVARWREAADEENCSFDEWIILTLNHGAARILSRRSDTEDDESSRVQPTTR